MRDSLLRCPLLFHAHRMRCSQHRSLAPTWPVPSAAHCGSGYYDASSFQFDHSWPEPHRWFSHPALPKRRKARLHERLSSRCRTSADAKAPVDLLRNSEIMTVPDKLIPLPHSALGSGPAQQALPPHEPKKHVAIPPSSDHSLPRAKLVATAAQPPVVSAFVLTIKPAVSDRKSHV